MKQRNKSENDDIRPEYDLDYSKARRSNYLERLLKGGSNIVVLKPEIAVVFPDSDSVNDALRGLIEIAERANTVEKKNKSHKKITSRKTSKPVNV